MTLENIFLSCCYCCCCYCRHVFVCRLPLGDYYNKNNDLVESRMGSSNSAPYTKIFTATYIVITKTI